MNIEPEQLDKLLNALRLVIAEGKTWACWDNLEEMKNVEIWHHSTGLTIHIGERVPTPAEEVPEGHYVVSFSSNNKSYLVTEEQHENMQANLKKAGE